MKFLLFLKLLQFNLMSSIYRINYYFLFNNKKISDIY